MIGKSLGVIFLALVFVLPFASAIDTQINVKTLPEHKVSIFVLDPGETYKLLDSYHINSDTSGIVSAKYSGIESEIKVNVKITKDGKTVIFEKFEDEFRAGESLYLKVIPGNISTNYIEDDKAKEAENNETGNTTQNTQPTQPTINATNSTQDDNETTTSSSTSSKKSGISGSAVFSEIKKYTKVYYILGIVLIVGVVIFFILRSGVIGKMASGFGNNKLSSNYDYEPIKYNFKDTEVENLENKMKSIQAEINRIKNQKKIQEAEKKLEEDRRRLEKLKKGEDI